MASYVGMPQRCAAENVRFYSPDLCIGHNALHGATARPASPLRPATEWSAWRILRQFVSTLLVQNLPGTPSGRAALLFVPADGKLLSSYNWAGN
jgi:hypothetical protein